MLSRDSDWADDSTWVEAPPVSPAPRLTSLILAATCAVPSRGLLHVARDLRVDGALLLDGGGDRRGDLGNAADRAGDALDGADRILRRGLHPGDLRADLLGRLAGLGGERLDLEATTAKPRPASPARAASMVALRASRLVCSAIAVISLTTSPMLAGLGQLVRTSPYVAAWAYPGRWNFRARTRCVAPPSGARIGRSCAGEKRGRRVSAPPPP